MDVLKFLLGLKTLEVGAGFMKEPCKAQSMPRVWKAKPVLGIKSKGHMESKN